MCERVCAWLFSLSRMLTSQTHFAICHARVHTLAAHVDIHFDLADLPLQVRFAGLDRDPGWVPAAGRFIAFYFD
jgi:hypothetical protein